MSLKRWANTERRKWGKRAQEAKPDFGPEFAWVKSQATWRHAIVFLGLLAITASLLGLLVWACAAYAQTGHGTSEQCEARFDDAEQNRGQGFRGADDFYGLGIRLGLYTQLLGLLVVRRYHPMYGGWSTSAALAEITPEGRKPYTGDQPVTEESTQIQDVHEAASIQSNQAGEGSGSVEETSARSATTGLVSGPIQSQDPDRQEITSGLSNRPKPLCMEYDRSSQQDPGAMQWHEHGLMEADRSIAVSYSAFQVGVVVALLLLVFREQTCTFTVELIIIHYIVIGGTFLALQIPLLKTSPGSILKAFGSNKRYEMTRRLTLEDLDGLGCATRTLSVCLLPVSVW